MRSTSLSLAGLTADLEAHLDVRLAAATGGAPRLLLYTLRALHYLCTYERLLLDSVDSIRDAVDERASRVLESVPTVHRELGPSDTSELSNAAYGVLFACVLYRKHLRYETVLKVGDQVHTVGRLLRSHAFFLSRDHQNLAAGEFVLTFPESHLRVMHKKYSTKGKVKPSAQTGNPNSFNSLSKTRKVD